MRRRTWLDPVLDPVDNAIYAVGGVDANQGMRWPAYVKAMLLTNLVMWRGPVRHLRDPAVAAA